MTSYAIVDLKVDKVIYFTLFILNNHIRQYII